MIKIAFPALLLLALSCSEKQLLPISNGSGKPDPVTILENIPVSGGALLKYQLPSNPDILSVKAVYTLTNGTSREVSASLYDNELLIEGYNDLEAHPVDIYTINRGQEVSDPIRIEVTPLESPLSKVARSLVIKEDFGGARFIWENEDQAPVVVDLLTADASGRMRSAQTVYSSSKSAYRSLRGYPAEPRQFAAVVKDRWDNLSDTLWANQGAPITPIYEQKVPKSGMTIYKLPNDADWNGYGYKDYYFFDDDTSSNNFMHSSGADWPVSITLDLGVTVKLSRLKIWQRSDAPDTGIKDFYYKRGNPQAFTVYGAAKLPAEAPEKFDNWPQNVHFEVIQPSGGVGGKVTNEDIEAAQQGHEFEFELTDAPVRYVRILFTKTWENQVYCHPSEITFWGQIQE